MTMFSAACYQFVKSVGKNTLIPVPTIDEKEKIQLLQLVVKTVKRSYFFFHKTRYHPTDFQVADVLTKQSSLEVKTENETELANYDRTTKLSLKGKFGADIAKELIDVELNTEDSITVKIDFGKIVKKEVKVPDLTSEINKRYINLEHPYIRQVMKDTRKVLCVITGMAYLDKDGTIHRETKWDANASVSSKLIRGTMPGADGEYDKGKDLGLVARTPVAYCVHELNVDKNNGAIQIVLAEGQTGGFKELVSYDEVDAIHSLNAENRLSLEADFTSPLKTFEPLLSLPEDQRREITTSLLCLLESSSDLYTIADLLERCEVKEMDENGEAISFVSPIQVVESVLNKAGITIKDNKVYPPQSATAMLSCLSEYFDAAAELDDDVLELIVKCEPDISGPLLLVLKDGIQGKTITDPDVVAKLTHDTTASHLKLLKELTYRFDENEIKAPIELPYFIDEIYWVMTALWGQKP